MRSPIWGGGNFAEALSTTPSLGAHFDDYLAVYGIVASHPGVGLHNLGIDISAHAIFSTSSFIDMLRKLSGKKSTIASRRQRAKPSAAAKAALPTYRALTGFTYSYDNNFAFKLFETKKKAPRCPKFSRFRRKGS